jgi:hypothetical protein
MRVKKPEVITLILLSVITFFPPWRIGDYTINEETGNRTVTGFYDNEWAFFLLPPSGQWVNVDVFLLLTELLIVATAYFLLSQIMIETN